MARGTKLLVIDDEEIVHRSCRRIFRSETLTLESAYSGEEGLKMVESQSFDLVITDLMMPGIGGMEVLRRLVQEKPEITVIVFTGYATVESAREALKLGAFDYIPKPFTPDELRKVVRNAVSARQEKSGRKALDLMAVVSHDLRSPVATMHATAETLYRGYFGNLEPQQQKTVEAILRNCVYLEDMIRSYLDLQNVDLEDLESYQADVSLVDDIIEPVLRQPEVQMNFRNMSTVVDYAARPTVKADPHLLKIVIANLLSNAVKYGRDGGEIRVNTRIVEGNSEVSIWNEGVGISPEDIRNRLFQMRSRLKQKGTEGVKGNGLGLYICRTIVEKHNGRIWCESEAGSWTRFSLSLPSA